VIWEDSANTLQSEGNTTLAGFYQRLGDIFERDQYESVRRTFGDPLRRDSVLDGDGKLQMVFSQRLNGSGAAAYVTSCDQFARNTTNRAGSNFGEVFYGFVPTNSALNIGSTASPDGWFNFMARTVVHEVKHIASMSARVANNAPAFEVSWLEEGTARHAEEVWVRDSLHRVPWKGNTGWGSAGNNGVFCDFNPLNGQCLAADALRRPGFGMRRHFNEIRSKMLQPWNWSIYGDGTGQSGSVFYQTVWSLVRYTIDRYAADERTFLTSLNSSTATGINNLSAVSGQSMDRLLALWGLALFADDYPGMPFNADVAFPTWNLRNIYAGLNTDPAWSNTFNTPYPLVPVALPFGAFTADRPGVRGGAHAYFELTGLHNAPQVLSLRGAGGSDIPPLARMAVLRLQ
jgi:hypothetical protein